MEHIERSLLATRNRFLVEAVIRLRTTFYKKSLMKRFFVDFSPPPWIRKHGAWPLFLPQLQHINLFLEITLDFMTVLFESFLEKMDVLWVFGGLVFEVVVGFLQFQVLALYFLADPNWFFEFLSHNFSCLNLSFDDSHKLFMDILKWWGDISRPILCFCMFTLL